MAGLELLTVEYCLPVLVIDQAVPDRPVQTQAKMWRGEGLPTRVVEPNELLSLSALISPHMICRLMNKVRAEKRPEGWNHLMRGPGLLPERRE
jgi:hypothetical protein